MTLLPIVGRELRVAARRTGTYWLRCLVATGALAMGSVIFLWSRQVSPAGMGLHLLIALSVLTFGFSLFAGIFMTADCLAEEKREGTLGLLFLTDLKAYDVVLGKLAATSLHAVFGVVAIAPVLGLPLMMGGVTGREFARLLLVFGSTLFFSLNLGMLVSAKSRESREAFTRGIVWVVVIAGVFPLARLFFSACFPSLPDDYLFWPSPACALFYGFDLQYRAGNGAQNFWMSTGLTVFMGCAFLGWTNLALPRSWRQTGREKAGGKGWFRRKRAEAKAGIFSRRRVYRENPVYWLAMGDTSGRSQAKRALFWLVALWFIFMVASVFSRLHIDAFCACFFTAYGLHVLVKVLYVAEASLRMFQERQSGALELLLVTPISVREILAGQRQALKRHFKGAFITLCAVNLWLAWETAVFPGLLEMRWQEQAVFFEVFGGGMLMLWLDLRALGWVGMWRGLNARRGHRAVLAALGQIMGVPWLLVFFIVFTQAQFGPTAEEAMVTIAVWFLIGALIDATAGYVARRKLERRFRSAVLQRIQPAKGWQ